MHRLQGPGLIVDVLPTPDVRAAPRADFAEWAGGRKRFRMEDLTASSAAASGPDGRPRTRRRPLELRPENCESPPRKQRTLGLPGP